MWMRLLLAVATAKVGLGLIGVPASFGARMGPMGVSGAAISALFLALGAAALLLFTGGRRDRRAILFGAWFLLAASSFAETLIAFVPGQALVAAFPVQLLRRLQVDAFLPFVLWLFVADFPRVRSFRESGTSVVFQRTSLAVGGALLLVNVALFARPQAETWPLIGLLDRTRSDGLYHPLLLVLSLAALVYSLARTTKAEPAERRRVRLLLFGVALGVLPITLVLTLQSLSPAFWEWSLSSPRAWVLQPLVYGPLLAIPLISAYAVYTRGALDVRLVIRAALRYAFARYTVATLAVVPFGALVALLYQNREARLIDLLTGGASAPLIAVAAFGLIGLRARVPILDSLDRRFFRERYDARRILSNLIQASRRTGSLAEMADLLASEVDQALHVHSFSFLALDPKRNQFKGVSGAVRSLPLRASIVEMVGDSEAGVRIDLEGRTPQPADLSEVERDWLLDSGAALLVPVRGTEGSLLGIFCLGARRGDLPFTREDTALLSDIGQAVGVNLENHLLRSSASHSEPSRHIDWVGVDGADDSAQECRECGRVVRATESACTRCGGDLIDAAVPLLLGNKFRLEERIGQGGMGVVYRATDLALDRSVAVKALPKVATRYAARLRQEARAMAAVSHPNLAPIFGAESWNGQPLLIVEHLAGGTLADRLRNGPLEPTTAISIASALAKGVEVLHAHGILHRDIKPSNVGLTADGQPKLLDFGLARLAETGRIPDPGGLSFGGAQGGVAESVSDAAQSARSGVVGTTLYMSPEALLGESPNPGFDLWSLSVLTYEILTGHNPFWGGSLQGAMARILSAKPRNIGDDLPECPAAMRAFMDRCLHPDPGERPGSAAGMKKMLDGLIETQGASH
jgi:hypothetical protein